MMKKGDFGSYPNIEDGWEFMLVLPEDAAWAWLENAVEPQMSIFGVDRLTEKHYVISSIYSTHFEKSVGQVRVGDLCQRIWDNDAYIVVGTRNGKDWSNPIALYRKDNLYWVIQNTEANL